MNQPHRILFIGNSYTYYNELWDRVAELAVQNGIEVSVDHVTKGGAKLALMLDPTSEQGQAVEQKLSAAHYDTVVLQDHSLRTILDPEGFAADMARLHAMVKQSGARTLLYQTWSRHPNSAKLNELGLTHESMTRVIAEHYGSVGRELTARVARVGEAFFDVVCHHPELELYDPDKTHPSPLGTALAALCIFLAIFDRIPDALPLGIYDGEQGEILKAAACAVMCQ
jgi:hypothetical protein